MILENLFSRRTRKEKNPYSDVYQYDVMPEKLKITLYKIILRGTELATKRDHNRSQSENNIYERIHTIICEEHSLHYLIKKPYYNDDYKNNVISFFNQNEDILITLDILQLSIMSILLSTQRLYGEEMDTLLNIGKEINQRMLEHGFGYQFEDGIIIKIDTKHTHKEIVKPALKLLNDKRFHNANEEYRDAFEALKREDYENVFVECNKAFESTMKIICEINKFTYKQSDISSKLISILSNNKFIEGYNEDMLNGLIKVLTTVSTLRNKEGGHGKGSKQQIEDLSYVNFALHSTASNILFLMERQQEFQNKHVKK